MMPSPKHEDNQEIPAGTQDSVLAKANLKGDWSNLFLLLLLYVMQGLPIGVFSAIPLLLQSNKNVTYKDQALFSLVGWPFSLKLLWAPLVDALYVQKIGRRKSWLVPVQYAIGAFLFYMASNINSLLPESGNINIMSLAIIFFLTNFMAATQDIVVDGWALTMLNKNNVGYASTCNAVGQMLGINIGSLFSILLTSEDFCNKYLRVINYKGGVLTMKSILYGWSFIFVLITTLIAIFKKEKDFTLDNVKLNVAQNYLLLWNILKLPSIRIFAIALITSKIGYAASDHVMIFKLIDAGISKENITIIHTAVVGIDIILPFLIGKYTSGPKPMSLYLRMIPIRLLMNIVLVILLHFTPMYVKENNGDTNIPIFYYAILIFILSLQRVLSCTMFVAIMAFFSRISDPRFGGTYMTLLNTIANIAYAWTSTAALGTIDTLTFKECTSNFKNNCSTKDLQKTCVDDGYYCITIVDGYYVEMTICTIIGITWYIIFRNIIKNFQTKSPSYWLVNLKKGTIENYENVYPTTVQ